MAIASDATEAVRAAARWLVEAAERNAGSTMIAYASVARDVGTSPTWVRKFVKGYEIKEPGWTVGFNIIEQYGRACARVELLIAAEKAANEQLAGKINEITGVLSRVGAGEVSGLSPAYDARAGAPEVGAGEAG